MKAPFCVLSMCSARRALLVLFIALPFSEQVLEYSDELARNVLWPIQVLTYGYPQDPDLGECFQKKIQGWEYIGGSSVPCETRDGLQFNERCQYIFARSEKERAVIVSVAIVPSKTRPNNLISDILNANSTLTDNATGVPIGRANANAVGVAYRLWMRGSVVKLYIDAFSKDYTYDYWCVGHGPGAVVADVLCFLMADDSHGDNDAYLTTFGSPRPGYLDFVEEREANFSGTFRVTQPGDRLLQVPGGLFKHHVAEIFYPDGTVEPHFKICTEREDKACSAGQKGDASVSTNSRYFNLSIHDGDAFCSF